MLDTDPIFERHMKRFRTELDEHVHFIVKKECQKINIVLMRRFEPELEKGLA